MTRAPAFSLLTYNVSGNGARDWSTNATQVQAIGRELLYLQPDIIAFNEIPNSYVWQMTNWVKAYLPGYYLATNSIGDGSIRSVIASRYPITQSTSWLHGTSLAAYGAPGYNFTRDLFEAQLTVPTLSKPLHVFTTHLKATTSSPQTDATRRAAEAGAISNFLVTTFLPGTNGSHPYTLSGDLNEDVYRPETNNYTSGQPIQRLTSPPTGLYLTTPLNPISGSDLTESIRGTLDVRFDYILPCGSLNSNIVSRQVFRTDLLTNLPPPLLTNDDSTASDHLPVLMVFNMGAIPPTITACASNRTFAAGVNCQALLPDLTSQVAASDASGTVTVTQNPPPGTALALGVTTVTFTARDSSSNASSCLATVTVADLAPPMILSCATNLTLASTTNCQAILPDLTSTNYILALDNCSSVTVTQMPATGTVFALGTTNLVVLTVFDAVGNATNRAVLVVVPGVPNITLQPTNLSRLVSSDATFTVAACGPGQLYYQWQHAGANLATATNPGLVLTGVSTNDAGGYTVVVSNTFGSTTSLVATLTVLQPPVITPISLDSANFTLSFPTEAGPTYAVEYKFTLDDQYWQVLTNVPGTGVPITITDNGLTNTMKFYRVRVQ